MKKKNEKIKERVFGENQDGVQTQDTRDKVKLKSKTKTSQRSRWSTSTDAKKPEKTTQIALLIRGTGKSIVILISAQPEIPGYLD